MRRDTFRISGNDAQKLTQILVDSGSVNTKARPRVCGCPGKFKGYMSELQIEGPPQVTERLMAEIGPMHSRAVNLCAQAFKINVTEEHDSKGMKLARESRLALRKLRTTAVNKCKDLKADALATGRAIDQTRRTIEDLFNPAEAHLLNMETFAERKQAERAEARRREREQAIIQAGGSTWDHAGFEDIADSEFHALIEGIKHEVARKKAEAEENQRRIEEQRLKEEAEAKRIREENTRLKAEAEERDRKAAEERRQQEEQLESERQARLKAEEENRKAKAAAEAEARAKARAEEIRRNAPVVDKLKALRMDSFDYNNFPEDIHRQLETLVDVWNRGIDRIIFTL